MQPDRAAILLVGLGHGDEGKGAWTDFLARTEPVHTVIRFNGGAQAGHNVVTADGRHHTFSQFGSGTFVRGVNTHLSRFVLVNPLRLLQEDEVLQQLGVTDALRRTSIDRRAPLTTPYHVVANRLRELARGDGRHGSFGMGIGETMADWLAHGDLMPNAADLADPATLLRKLTYLRDLKIEQLRDVLALLPATDAVERERRLLFDGEVIETCGRLYGHLATQVRLGDEDDLRALLRIGGTLVFEGAQGVLLDEWRGFHPYTTWSTTTFQNALSLLQDADFDGEIVKIGLLRAYATRHGAGPFPTENALLAGTLTDRYNVTNAWQHGLRVWPLDVVALRYAIEVAGQPDLLAVSHLDQLAGLAQPRIAVAYRCPAADAASLDLMERRDGLAVRVRPSPEPEDLGYQERLTQLLAQCRPVLWDAPTDADTYLEAVEDLLGVPVGLRAAGPTAEDRAWYPPR
jgi:adenylosuccinate synthase